MPTRIYLRVTEILIAATLAIAVLAAWRAARRDRAQLAAELAVANQSLTQATARQHDREAQLQKTLAALAAEKRRIKTPAQILQDLPNQIVLPRPITLNSADPATGPATPPCSSGLPRSSRGPNCAPEGLDPTTSSKLPTSKPDPSRLVLPLEDLKPLYNFALDCRACQAKLAAAQADLADERAKTAVLTRERNEAVRAAKGGGVLRRIVRNAKWLAIGAAAGALAAKAHP